MKFLRAIAYNGISVIVELRDGRFALVSIDEVPENAQVTVSCFAESFLKFGYFEEFIPEEAIIKAKKVLETSKNIFIARK